MERVGEQNSPIANYLFIIKLHTLFFPRNRSYHFPINSYLCKVLVAMYYQYRGRQLKKAIILHWLVISNSKTMLWKTNFLVYCLSVPAVILLDHLFLKYNFIA